MQLLARTCSSIDQSLPQDTHVTSLSDVYPLKHKAGSEDLTIVATTRCLCIDHVRCANRLSMYGKSISVPHDSVGETFSLVEIAHENAEVNFPIQAIGKQPQTSPRQLLARTLRGIC